MRSNARAGPRPVVPTESGYTRVVKVALINAPSALGLRPSGVELLPEALGRAGLTSALPIASTTTVKPPPYDPHPDPSGVLNARSLAAYSRDIAAAVAQALAGRLFALVLGGDCSVVLGSALGLRRAGRYGLFFIDGHADFYQPQASPTGEAADMDLAMATGRGPRVLTNIDGLQPYVLDVDVVHFGQRDREETIHAGSRQLDESEIQVLDAETIGRVGAGEAARQALAVLTHSQSRGFWIHLDADVVSDDEMPAVDYRLPGGLPLADVRIALAQALASGWAVGMSVAVFNPRLDPTGAQATKLVECITGAFKDAA